MRDFPMTAIRSDYRDPVEHDEQAIHLALIEFRRAAERLRESGDREAMTLLRKRLREIEREIAGTTDYVAVLDDCLQEK